MRAALVALTSATFSFSSPVQAADPAAGKAFFEQLCIGCHSAQRGDNGGAQGPSLVGFFGKRATSDKEFAYTQQLVDAKLTWDEATLNRFLAAPDTVVPGTAMLIAVTSKTDRNNLIAYFRSVADSAARSRESARQRVAARN